MEQLEGTCGHLPLNALILSNLAHCMGIHQLDRCPQRHRRYAQVQPHVQKALRTCRDHNEPALRLEECCKLKGNIRYDPLSTVERVAAHL